MTTVAEWLDRREPAPPAALLRRLLEALGEEAGRDVRDVADVCLATGERLVATVLRDEDANRNSALDLLAADALITYAFEAAGEEESPHELSRRAARAMSSIASLGAPASAGERPSRT